ncbi:MAG: glycosyltransferase [Thermoprotei archaeon]
MIELVVRLRKISVVIPTYNERENISELIKKLESLELNLEIIIVDDNSPDNTAEEAMKLADKYNNIKVLKRPGKLGLGSAIADGMKIASGDYIAVMDADLQHPPEKLLEIYKTLENGSDIVIASRYVEGGIIKGWSFYRKIVSKGATLLAHLLLPETKAIKDPLSGFFAFKRTSINNFIPSTHGYKILLELLYQSKVENIKIAEIPYTFITRKRGKSKLSLSEMLRYLNLILKLNEYRIIKFMMVGVIGILVNEGVLYYLVENSLKLIYASPLAIETSIISNHLLNNIWTFKTRSTKKINTYLDSLAKYHVSVLLGAIVNFASLVLLTSLGFHYLLSNILGIFLGFISNYLFSEHFVWKRLIK